MHQLNKGAGRWSAGLVSALALSLAVGVVGGLAGGVSVAQAGPMAVVDRNGSYASVETYAYEREGGKTVKPHWDDKAGKLTASGDKGLGAQALAAVQIVSR